MGTHPLAGHYSSKKAFLEGTFAKLGLKSGQSFTHEISDYAGAPARPFSWMEVAAKFDKLAAGHASEKSRDKIKNAVCSLEDIQVSDLMEVLSAV